MEDTGKTIIKLGGGSWTFDLPQSITYQTEYGWESMELGTAGLVSQGSNGYSLRNVVDNITTQDARAAGSRAFMQTNAFNLGNVTSAASKEAPNPKEAIMFKGVQFRSYSLSFLIASESSDKIKEKAAAVNEMQVAAAPDLKSKQFFFTYPDAGTLRIKDGSTDIIKERDIVITSIETDMTPNGYFATWSKGGPVSFNLTVGITELHLPTKKNDKNILGFA